MKNILGSKYVTLVLFNLELLFTSQGIQKASIRQNISKAVFFGSQHHGMQYENVDAAEILAYCSSAPIWWELVPINILHMDFFLLAVRV